MLTKAQTVKPFLCYKQPFYSAERFKCWQISPLCGNSINSFMKLSWTGLITKAYFTHHNILLHFTRIITDWFLSGGSNTITNHHEWRAKQNLSLMLDGRRRRRLKFIYIYHLNRLSFSVGHAIPVTLWIWHRRFRE